MTSWMYRWYDPDGDMSPDTIADEFLKLVEHGYVRSGGSSH
jgi:hypothetical protein